MNEERQLYNTIYNKILESMEEFQLGSLCEAREYAEEIYQQVLEIKKMVCE